MAANRVILLYVIKQKCKLIDQLKKHFVTELDEHVEVI